jgi:hypothetical protein
METTTYAAQGAEIADTADATTPAGEDTECRSDAARCSTSVAMEVAYPAAAEEDCVIGELDVLIALRSYLAALNKPAEPQEAPTEAVTETPVESASATMEVSTAEEAATTPVTTEEIADQSTLSCASTRSSTSSAGTFEGKTEWRDSLVPSDRRTSCTTTMRVSFCAAPRLSSMPSNASIAVAPAPADMAEAALTSVTESTSAAAPAPVKAKGVVTYPLRELLDDALQRGLVVANVTGRMELGTHTKYTVQTQVSVP